MHAFVLFCLLNVKMQDLRGGGFSRWSLYLANLLKSGLSEKDTKKVHRLLYHSLRTNVEKVLLFDKKTLRGVHRLFRGVHFLLGGCKWQRGCILNDRSENSHQKPRSTKSYTIDL